MLKNNGCGTVVAANGELLGTYITRDGQTFVKPTFGPLAGEMLVVDDAVWAETTCRAVTLGWRDSVAAQERIAAR